MRKRSRKPEPDTNEIAASIVAQVSGQAPLSSPEAQDKRNPAAVALGRLGGLKGGTARAKKLSAKKRSAIAKKAARARWAR